MLLPAGLPRRIPASRCPLKRADLQLAHATPKNTQPLATETHQEQNSHRGAFLAPSLGLSSPASACPAVARLCSSIVCVSSASAGMLFCQRNINYTSDAHKGQRGLFSFHGSQPRRSYPDGVIPTGGCLNVPHAASRSGRITRSSAGKAAAAKRQWLNWSSVSAGL